MIPTNSDLAGAWTQTIEGHGFRANVSGVEQDVNDLRTPNQLLEGYELQNNFGGHRVLGCCRPIASFFFCLEKDKGRKTDTHLSLENDIHLSVRSSYRQVDKPFRGVQGGGCKNSKSIVDITH